MENQNVIENQQREIEELKARIRSLEIENDEITQACDRNSVRMTKVMRKNREYIEEIRELRNENERVTFAKAAVVKMMINYVSKN